MPKETLNP